MHPRRDDRIGIAAARYVRQAADRARSEAASAVECLQCGSALGVRHHLKALRDVAERRARIERHLLHQSSRSAQLRRAADAALLALDSGSPARLTRALTRIEELAR